MPRPIVLPDDGALLATHDSGAKLYATDPRAEMPLYRNVKLIAPAPVIAPRRRTAVLTWVCHDQRLKYGGDSWLLQKQAPALLAWIAATLAAEYSAEYLARQFDSAADMALCVAAERAKYGGKNNA